jgi:hypothetical protein
MMEEERRPLVVVGSINADLVIELDRGLPQPGETISSSSLNVYPGGKVSERPGWVGATSLLSLKEDLAR